MPIASTAYRPIAEHNLSGLQYIIGIGLQRYILHNYIVFIRTEIYIVWVSIVIQLHIISRLCRVDILYYNLFLHPPLQYIYSPCFSVFVTAGIP